MADAFGRAIRDRYRNEQDEPLVQRDGDEVQHHPIEEFYFDEFDPESDQGRWLESWLDGPLLDVGAGAGRDALYFQERYETVAVDVSEPLVELMDERGVVDARRVDMFDLRGAFERDRFRSLLMVGTQLGLVGSMRRLRKLLGELAYVTDPGGAAVVDNYHPDREGTRDLIGYRDDPTPGLAYRIQSFEYEEQTDPPLLFLLFSPDRLREACVGTGWKVADVRYTDGSHHYQAALEKR